MHLVPDAASAEALSAEQQDASVDQVELDCRELQLFAATLDHQRDAVTKALANMASCQPAHPVGLRCQQAGDDEVQYERYEPRRYLRHCVAVQVVSGKSLSAPGGRGDVIEEPAAGQRSSHLRTHRPDAKSLAQRRSICLHLT